MHSIAPYPELAQRLRQSLSMPETTDPILTNGYQSSDASTFASTPSFIAPSASPISQTTESSWSSMLCPPRKSTSFHQVRAELASMGKLTDFAIHVHHCTFHVHKSILLVSGSPYLASLVTSNANTDGVRLTDPGLEPRFVGKVINYLYTGQYWRDSRLIFQIKLYMCANHFRIDKLALGLKDHILRTESINPESEHDIEAVRHVFNNTVDNVNHPFRILILDLSLQNWARAESDPAVINPVLEYEPMAWLVGRKLEVRRLCDLISIDRDRVKRAYEVYARAVMLEPDPNEGWEAEIARLLQTESVTSLDREPDKEPICLKHPHLILRRQRKDGDFIYRSINNWSLTGQGEENVKAMVNYQRYDAEPILASHEGIKNTAESMVEKLMRTGAVEAVRMPWTALTEELEAMDTLSSTLAEQSSLDEKVDNRPGLGPMIKNKRDLRKRWGVVRRSASERVNGLFLELRRQSSSP